MWHDLVMNYVAPLGFFGGIAYLMGWTPRRRPKADPNAPICTCKHPLSSHDPQTDRCYTEIDWHMQKGKRISQQCPCRQYVGPKPIDQVFQPRILPPADGD